MLLPIILGILQIAQLLTPIIEGLLNKKGEAPVAPTPAELAEAASHLQTQVGLVNTAHGLLQLHIARA